MANGKLARKSIYVAMVTSY